MGKLKKIKLTKIELEKSFETRKDNVHSFRKLRKESISEMANNFEKQRSYVENKLTKYR